MISQQVDINLSLGLASGWSNVEFMQHDDNVLLYDSKELIGKKEQTLNLGVAAPSLSPVKICQSTRTVD